MPPIPRAKYAQQLEHPFKSQVPLNSPNLGRYRKNNLMSTFNPNLPLFPWL